MLLVKAWLKHKIHLIRSLVSFRITISKIYGYTDVIHLKGRWNREKLLLKHSAQNDLKHTVDYNKSYFATRMCRMYDWPFPVFSLQKNILHVLLNFAFIYQHYNFVTILMFDSIMISNDCRCMNCVVLDESGFCRSIITVSKCNFFLHYYYHSFKYELL